MRLPSLFLPQQHPKKRLECAKLSAESDLLKKDDVSSLCKHLSPDYTKEWKLLFSSKKDGKSFTRFGTLSCHQGPTIVVVRDSNGYTFGGFTDESWKSHADRVKEGKAELAAQVHAAKYGQQTQGSAPPRSPPAFFSGDKSGPKMFYGGDRCFLFSVFPELAVYRSSGYNANFMYYEEVSIEKENVGCGMGGQRGFHGWFLDDWLEHGHSRGAPLCTTFTSPRLSKEEDFEVDSVEVWAVAPSDSHVPGPSVKSGGLLTDNKDALTDKMILELGTDKKFYSDDVKKD